MAPHLHLHPSHQVPVEYLFSLDFVIKDVQYGGVKQKFL